MIIIKKGNGIFKIIIRFLFKEWILIFAFRLNAEILAMEKENAQSRMKAEFDEEKEKK